MVERYSFRVVPAEFKVNVSDARVQPLQGGKHTDPDTRTRAYIVGTNYRILPRTLLEHGTEPSKGTFNDTRYTIENAPDGWFVSAKTGEISGAFGARGVYEIGLFAYDKAGLRGHIQTYNFTVRAPPRLLPYAPVFGDLAGPRAVVDHTVAPRARHVQPTRLQTWLTAPLQRPPWQQL